MISNHDFQAGLVVVLRSRFQAARLSRRWRFALRLGRVWALQPKTKHSSFPDNHLLSYFSMGLARIVKKRQRGSTKSPPWFHTTELRYSFLYSLSSSKFRKEQSPNRCPPAPPVKCRIRRSSTNYLSMLRKVTLGRRNPKIIILWIIKRGSLSLIVIDYSFFLISSVK